MTANTATGAQPSPSPSQTGSIDLTGEPNIFTKSPAVDTSVIAKTTSTDVARIGLSFLLVSVLAFVVIVSVVSVWVNNKSEGSIDALLKVVLSPIIGLVGSVVGFYFGAKASGGSTPS